MDLSIIIVNYNVKEFLQNLLHSIDKASKNLSTEIFIVDNASDDGSIELIKNKFPDVNLIENDTNLGFGKANNIALEKAKGEFILLINPDTIVAENTLQKSIDFLKKNKDAGLVGCKILNPDGTLQLACRRSFPGPWTSFCKVTGLSNLFPSSKLFARYNLTFLDENQTYEVDAISGSFMMMKRDVYEKVGGFDEQFFMYGEDLDLCYRIQKAGYKVYYLHTTQIIHYKGESTKRSSFDETKTFYDAMHLFVKKHLSSSFLVEFILRSAIGIRKSFAFLGKRKLILLSILLDFIFFDIALFIAENIYANASNWVGFPEYAYPVVYVIPALIHIFVSAFVGVYRRERLSVFQTFIALFISILILTSLTFFFKQYAFSRAVVLITYLFLAILLPLWRIIIKLTFNLEKRDEDRSSTRTLIIGSSNGSAAIAEKLKSKTSDIHKVIGLIGSSNREIGNKINGFEVVGTEENLRKIIRDQKVNEVIFSSGETEYNKMMQMVALCQDESVDFKLIGDNRDFIVGKTSVSLLDDMPLIEINYNISNTKHKLLKTFLDYLLGLPALFLVYPFLYFKTKLTGKTPDLSRFILGIPSVILRKKSFVGPKESSINAKLYLGKPGLTGLWYVENPDEREREKLDIYYAKNQNIWLDLEILGRSLNKMFNKE